MLRFTISRSSEAATSYFNEGLSKEGNYYLDKKINTHWKGETSKLLGLEGKEVNKNDFSKLANNIHPESHNERLTVRNVEKRKAGYDATINVPKSVSIVQFFTQDKKILEAINSSNEAMMKAIEADAQTQANIGNERFYTNTKNIVYSPFLHYQSRPSPIKENGKTVYANDPMIHVHNFVMNVTHNPIKERMQSLELGNIWRNAEYYQEVFHSNLSHKLNRLGYAIERTHDRYEIKEARQFNERFSNRTKHIEKVAKEKNITDPKALSQLGAKTRLPKSKSLSEKALHKNWMRRLNPEETKHIKNIKGKHTETPKAITPKQAIDMALEHHFERKSAAPTKRILATALKYGYSSFLPEAAEKELNSRKNVVRSEIDTIEYLTTHELIRAEDRLIDQATAGKGKFPALNSKYKPKQKILSDEQRNVIKDILASNDQTNAIKGFAGTGKTTVLSEINAGIKQAKKPLIAVAPSTQAVNVLKKKGFDAYTIASLLHPNNTKLQDKLNRGVLLVDEAGMIGVKTMSDLLDLTSKNKARAILSGDTKQHSSVLAGDAMRILEEKAKLKTATIKTIIRQKPEDYRKAVQKLAVGKTKEGFKALDKMNAIKELPDHDKRMETIANDYVLSVTKNRSALIISPTHAEGGVLADTVRKKLREKGKLAGKDRSFETLKSLSFTEAQKKDTANYKDGDMVRFTRNQKGGFKAGIHYEVIQSNSPNEIIVRHSVTGQKHKLPHAQPEHFQVYQKTETALAKGDLIRLTNNSKTIEGNKIANGTRHKITGFTKAGDLRLSNGKTLSKSSKHFTQGYVETSHSSQGKDAQDLFIAQSEMSFAGSSREQFYVSVSRGTHSVKIYTSDKIELKKYISRSGERMSAHEVARGHEQRLFQQKQRNYQKTINKKIKEHGRIQPRAKSPARDISR